MSGIAISARAIALGAVLGVTALIGPLAASAGAEVSGPCTGNLNGQDIAGRSSTKTKDAIDVDYRQQVVAGSTAAGAIDGYKVQLEFGGFRWTVGKGAANGNSWQRTVPVKDYASHGVGLYKVIGTSTGAAACSGAVLVNVTGKNPLTTTAGIIGAGLIALGAVAIVGSALRALSGVASGRRLSLVGVLIAPMMITGGPGMAGLDAAEEPDSPGEAARWHLRVSILGVLGGIFGGLGGVVLLQQYAVAYPTRGVLIAGTAGGALLSLASTNLGGFLGVRRLNRKAVTAEATVVATLADMAVLPADTAALPAQAEPSGVWAPTHTTSGAGAEAWAEPDATGAPADKLDPWLPVEIVERSGSWAQVRCSNGWTAWVDGAQLIETAE